MLGLTGPGRRRCTRRCASRRRLARDATVIDHGDATTKASRNDLRRPGEARHTRRNGARHSVPGASPCHGTRVLPLWRHQSRTHRQRCARAEKREGGVGGGRGRRQPGRTAATARHGVTHRYRIQTIPLISRRTNAGRTDVVKATIGCCRSCTSLPPPPGHITNPYRAGWYRKGERWPLRMHTDRAWEAMTHTTNNKLTSTTTRPRALWTTLLHFPRIGNLAFGFSSFRGSCCCARRARHELVTVASSDMQRSVVVVVVVQRREHRRWRR